MSSLGPGAIPISASTTTTTRNGPTHGNRAPHSRSGGGRGNGGRGAAGRGAANASHGPGHATQPTIIGEVQPPEEVPHLLATFRAYLDRLQAPDFNPPPMPISSLSLGACVSVWGGALARVGA